MNENIQQVASDALVFAHTLTDEVATRLLGHFGGVRDAEVKRDGTLVTQADVEADRLIARAIQQHYPDHDIVSEELDTLYEGAAWCWIIDPVDGTTNFAQGIPVWAVSIALAYAGWPVMGLVDLPPLGIRYHAIRGGGAYANGKAISVRPAIDWSNTARSQNELMAVCSRTLQRFTLDVPMKPRIIGSAAYNFCLTAAGICVAAMEVTPKVWDIAAGWLVVHEAGGVVTQLEGDPMFPLVAGRDYATIIHPQLSTPNVTVANELRRRIRQR